MAFSDAKINYYQSMFRVLSRRLLAFAAVFQIACMLLSVGAAQVINSQAQIQEHFLAAQQAQQQGQLDAAAHQYREVLRLQPALPEAYVNLGLVYYAQSKFDDSAKALTAAGKLRPGMRGVSLWLGIDYVKLNRPLQAIPLLREAVRQDPSSKLGQSWLGTALWDAGQMDAALLQLRHAAALAPDDPDLLFALGEAYEKAATQQTEQLLHESSGTALSDIIYGRIYTEDRDWAKAEGHLRRAIKRDSQSLDAGLDARLELADVFLEQARLSDANDQLVIAAAKAPRSAAVLARQGELLLLMHRDAEGLTSIQEALKIDQAEALDALGLPLERRIGAGPAGVELSQLCNQAVKRLEADPVPSPARDVSLAAFYAQAGNEEAAQQAYKRIATDASNRDSSASLFDQAMNAFRQHDYDRAEPILLRWIAAHPADRDAKYKLVIARRQISIAQLAHMIAVAPDSYHVHQMLGQLYASREEDDQAIAEYLAVAAAEPNLPGIHFRLGHLYWKHGDADRAVEELTKELKLDPGHPEANGELGTVLVAEYHPVEAIPHLESAIRSKPDLWPAYSQLGRAYAMQKNYARAEETLNHALAHDEDGAVHYQLGQVLRAEGKSAKAAQMFAQVRAIKIEKMSAPVAADAPEAGANQ